MFCKNCGNEILDDAKFCGNCGFTTENEEVFENAEAPVQSEAVTDAPVQDEVVTEALAQNEDITASPVSDTPAEETYFAQASFDPTVAPAKKKKIAPIIIATVAIILVIAIILTIVIINKNKKNQDGEGSLLTVLSQNTDIEEKAHAVVDMYDTFSIDRNASSKTQYKLNIPEETAQLLNSFISEETGVQTDFAALNDVTLDYNVNLADGIYQNKITLNCGNKALIDFEAITDYNEMITYIGCPSLSDTYLIIPDDDTEYGPYYSYGSSTVILDMYQSMMVGQVDYSELLPTKDELSTIVDTYLGIAKPYLENDSEKSSKLTVNNTTQNVTEYTMDITKKEMLEIFLSVLETAKNDSTIYAIVDRFSSYIAENYRFPNEGFDKITREEYSEAIDKAISELKKNESSNDILFSLVRFVDSDNKIIGRKIYSEGEEVFYHATVTEGSNYASVFELAELSVDGNGTISDGKKTGTYNIDLDDKKYTFNIKDFSIKSNSITGSVIYYLEDEVIDNMTDNAFLSMFASNANLGVELKFISVTETTANYELNFIAGEKMLAGITFNTETDSKEKVSVPSKTTPQENAEEWLENIDEDALLDKLRNSPLGFLVEIYDKAMEETDYSPLVA